MVLLAAPSAFADQALASRPGAHPDYHFEAEPHVLLEPFDADLGVGFRGTLEIVDNGFIPSINNTVGLGFGLDLGGDRFWIPVVMQWNFWVSRNWSVFGEPGIVLRQRFRDDDETDLELAIFGGARLHLLERITLTLRVGTPSFSAGVSFLL